MRAELATLIGSAGTLIYLLIFKKSSTSKSNDSSVSSLDGETIIYDLGKNYPQHSYSFDAANEKELWIKIPISYTGKIKNDVVIKTRVFYLYLHSSPSNSVFTFPDIPYGYLKGEEMYSIYPNTPKGYSAFGGTSQKREIIINTDIKKIIRSISYPIEKPDGIWTVGMTYTFFKNYNWMKMEGYSEPGIVAAEDQGCHGETRFIILPDVPRDKVDKIYDSKYFITSSMYDWVDLEPSKMLLNFYIASDSIVIFTYDIPASMRSGLEWGRYNWGGGWGHTEEEIYGDDPGSTYGVWGVTYTELPCYYTILNGQWKHLYWNYMGVKQTLNAGDVFKSFRIVYDRSPIYNQQWKPSIMGIWRINAKVGDNIFTQEVDVKEPDDLLFLMPQTNILEYVLCYIYDRNEKTPVDFTTPMDVYRETRGK